MKSPKDYRVRIEKNGWVIRLFVKHHHYSKTCPNGLYHFGLYENSTLIGGAVFGQVIGRNQPRKYFPENPNKLIELRRLVLLDSCPKNSETRFISVCLRWLEVNTDYLAVLSLADRNFNHDGIIYRASNFQYLGETEKDGHPRIKIKGVERHSRDFYDRHGTSSLRRLKQIYGNDIEFIEKKPKAVYLYRLRQSSKRRTPFVQKGDSGSNPTLTQFIK